MNNLTMNVWGRNLSLEVVYDYYRGEEILDIQKTAFENFLKVKNIVPESLDKVKEYCLKRDKENIEENSIENIFKYVIPKEIFIKRSENKRIVALMCKYKFDIEHGIAIVFENEEFLKVIPQDEIL